MISLRYISKDLLEQAEVMKIILYEIGTDTILPEIYEIFGKEKFLDFLSIFGGMNIQIPDIDIIETAVRDAIIFHRLISLKSPVEREKEKRVICKDYDLSIDEVVTIYNHIYDNAKEMGLIDHD